MKKILITGSSGFIGSNLYDYLHEDYFLYGLDLGKLGKYPKSNLFHWDQVDELPGIDVIIHLAGKAHDTANTSKSEEYFDVNLGLTKKIFDHFLSSEASVFIFFSSVKAVADEVNGILTENDVPDPKTPYGKSKLAAENYITSKDISNAKKVYILRPCMIHGPGNKGNLNLLYNLVKKGIPWPLGAFDNLRSFVSMDNVVFILKELLSGSIPSGIYQIADDQPISTNELIKLMGVVMNEQTRILNISSPIIHAFSAIGDWLNLPLNSERLKKLTESYVVSNLKIKNALNVDSLPTDVRDGLIKTINSL